MYFGRIINSNILQAYEDSGSPNAQIQMSSLYVATSTGHCGPTFPALEPSFAVAVNCGGKVNGASSGTATTVAYLDPHMQNPQVHEADLAIEHNLGHKTVLGLTYMMSLGRELPRAIDTNINLQDTAQVTFTVAAPTSTTATNTNITLSTTKVVAPPQPAQTGNVTLPHGGATAPLTVGQTYTTKVFLASTAQYARPNQAYGQILDVQSSVNSSYNALAVQINHPFDHGFSLMSNYTWSHSLDDNPYQSTVVPTFNVLDPTNLKAEHANGSLDIRQRFVFAAVYQPQTHFHGLEDKVLGGWRIAPMVQMQTGMPYTPYVSGSVSGSFGTAAYKSLNGSGSSSARLPWIERNSYHRPKTAVVDLRLGKNFFFEAPHFDRMRFEVFGEVFNLMNHQNITGINDQAYSLYGTTLTQNPVSVRITTPTATGPSARARFRLRPGCTSNHTSQQRQRAAKLAALCCCRNIFHRGDCCGATAGAASTAGLGDAAAVG